MTRTRTAVAIAILALVVSSCWLASPSVRDAQAQQSHPGGHDRGAGHAHADHEHPAVPAEYASVAIQVAVWTDPKAIAKGKEIFVAKCALCHGENGDGKGPGSVNLPLKPADLTDGRMVADMSGNYWLWRVSEGGLVEPFKSKGSVMPAWKGELSMSDRLAVIAYAHTLSGHHGPHAASEHPELGAKPKLASGQGMVVSVASEKQTIVLEHGEIKGFMGAMTMGYKVESPSLLKEVKAGDKVRFTIDTGARVITKIERAKD